MLYIFILCFYTLFTMLYTCVQVLLTKFAANNKLHKDIRWSNIGKYKDKTTGKVVIVIYDLLNVVDYSDSSGGEHESGNASGNNYDWIARAIETLYIS